MGAQETTGAAARRSYSLGKVSAAAVGLAIAVTMAIVVAVSVFQLRSQSAATFERDAAVTTDLLAETLSGAVKFRKQDILLDSFEAFAGNIGEDVAWLAAVDAEGAILAMHPSETAEPSAVIDAAREAVDTEGNWIEGGVIATPVRFGKDGAIAGALVTGWSDARIGAQIKENARDLVVIGIAIAVAMMAAAYAVMSRFLVGPLLEIGEAMKWLANGELSHETPHASRRDELGEMARSTEDFRRKIAEGETLRAEQAARDREVEEDRKAMMAKLENGIGSIVTAARDGVFDCRVEVDFGDPVLDRLGARVNEICETVDAFLDETERAVGALADGDLSDRMADDHAGRFGEVARRVNATIDQLESLVAELVATSSVIHGGVETLASGALDLSQRTEAQAAALEETAATMEQIASSVTSTADNVRMTAKGADEVQQHANRGREVVSEAVRKMGEIEQGSRKITDIITLIDDIAFQTNLLALNAAVEAARAGDAGKGFAVVANEVRTLAQRSADAANDIKQLITRSQSTVDDGARLVRATGEALETIIGSVGTVVLTVADISSATREQATSVNEISSAVSSLDATTQQNAQVADQSAVTARELRDQAARLADQISFFRAEAWDQDIAMTA